MLTKMLCKPRPPVICIEIGKRDRRPCCIPGFAMQQTTPPSFHLFVVEDARGVGIVSPVSSGKYIKKIIIESSHLISHITMPIIESCAPIPPLLKHAPFTGICASIPNFLIHPYAKIEEGCKLLIP